MLPNVLFFHRNVLTKFSRSSLNFLAQKKVRNWKKNRENVGDYLLASKLKIDFLEKKPSQAKISKTYF